MKHVFLLLVVSTCCAIYLVSSSELDGLSLTGFRFSESESLETDEASFSASTPATESVDDSAEGWAGSGSAPELVLMKFGAPWCPPCRAIDKELRKLGRMDLPVEIRKIDVDERPQLAEQYKVRSIPRLILLQNGRKIGDQTGYLSVDELSDWISTVAAKEVLAAEKQPSRPSVVHANPYFE